MDLSDSMHYRYKLTIGFKIVSVLIVEPRNQSVDPLQESKALAQICTFREIQNSKREMK